MKNEKKSIQLIQKCQQLPQEKRDLLLKQNLDSVSLGEFVKNLMGAEDYYPICYAAEKGYSEIVKLLIEAGADVTANNNYAIKKAAANGYIEVVELLIEAGADVTANNNYAIKKAAANGYIEVVELLIEAGADVNEAICAAVEEGNIEIAKRLIRKRNKLKS